ncbi:unnamed protein product [Prunus brigantina]
MKEYWPYPTAKDLTENKFFWERHDREEDKKLRKYQVTQNVYHKIYLPTMPPTIKAEPKQAMSTKVWWCGDEYVKALRICFSLAFMLVCIIPREIGNLTMVKEIHLYSNNFKGMLFLYDSAFCCRALYNPPSSPQTLPALPRPALQWKFNSSYLVWLLQACNYGLLGALPLLC